MDRAHGGGWREGFRDPGVMALVAVALLAAPVAVWLVREYPTVEERLWESAGPVVLPAPTERELVDRVLRPWGGGGAYELQRVYAPPREPISGLCAVYRVKQENSATGWLAVVRHNIQCQTCRDVLAAAVFDREVERVEMVALLDMWEVRGAPVQTDGFVAQFSGVKADKELVLGQNVDGISGATLSTRGLVQRLNQARRWLVRARSQGELE